MNNYFSGGIRLLGSLMLGLALTQAAPAFAAESAPASASYMTESALHCGELDISIESYCRFNDNQDGACFLQKLKLRHAGSSKLTEKFYLYENYLKDQSMIVQLSCVKGQGKNLLMAESSNLGNCKDCEWHDFFSETGAYLGSDRTKFGASNSKPKALPGNFAQKNGLVTDSEGHFTVLDKVWVNREPRKEK